MLDLTLSIVIPVYRSQLILPALVNQIQTEMTRLELTGNFELILVNDASPDNSWSVIQDLSKSFSFVKGISLRKNFGQHNTTMAGLNHAQGKYIVIMDDDLQHSPKYIGEMINKLSGGYDVCYTHYLNRQHALWKKIGSRFNDWVATLILDKPKGLYLSSYKALCRDVVCEVVKYNGPYAYLDGLILDITQSITTIEIQHEERYSGAGNYNFRRSVSLWLKMATSFSIWPLRFASIAGMGLSLISFMMIIVVFIQKYLHPNVAIGWASIISVLLFIGGIQTMCIGLIGEYLGRAYLKINSKPQFVIGQLTWEEWKREE